MVRNKRKCRSLPRICFPGNTVAIDIQPVNDIRADELDRDGIARVYLEFRGGVCKLPRLDPKRSLLRREGRDWQWFESHYQPGHC